MNKVIILAAGEGTRMKSNTSKVLHKICNRTILSYIIDCVKSVNMDEIMVIVGNNEEEVKKTFSEDIVYIRQYIGKEYPYGTGYAVKLAENRINDEDNILVLTADVPLITEKTIKNLIDSHINNKSDATVLSALFENPSGYGRIIKDDNGNFEKIIEHKDCNSEELLVKEINSGITIFNGGKLKYALNKLNTNNAKGELYITDVFEILHRENSKISTYILDDNHEIMGINTKIQLSEVEMVMRRRINNEHMLNGVIMENPDTITIEKDVKIGRDTIIEQNVKILGNTIIGENSVIGMNSKIENSVIGNNVIIQASYIEKSVIEDSVDIGPFARIRPNSNIKQKVHIGNFVEVKNAVIDEETKAGHLAYIGDADLGKRINVSCGVIFANYDGKNKFRSKVGDDAFIGSNVNIISPVEIENKGFLAAGSTITKKVEEGQLAIERSEQKNVDGYYNKKLKK